jgi:hypothetical protein
LLALLSPSELRQRYAAWLNDAKKGCNSLLYWDAPDAKDVRRLRAVPSSLLHHFFDDIAYDWAAFVEGAVPPLDGDGKPLFDPRFVRVARQKPTAADKAAAWTAAPAPAPPLPVFGTAEALHRPPSVAQTPADVAARCGIPKKPQVGKAEEEEEEATAPAPAPKAKPAPKPKAKAAPKAKGAATPKRGVTQTIDSSLVHPDTAAMFMESHEIRMFAVMDGAPTAPTRAGTSSANAGVAAAAATQRVSTGVRSGMDILAIILSRPTNLSDAAVICRGAG